MTLVQALADSPAPREILESQTLLNLPFVDFANEENIGQLVVSEDLAGEISEIFRQIFLARFPLAQMVPIVAFGWSDDDSMAANNCSGFNYRLKVGKNSLSTHSFGRAIDINPVCNPYFCGDLVLPPGAKYDVLAPGTLTCESVAVQVFESFGWIWGGRWTTLKDFHHFEKP